MQSYRPGDIVQHFKKEFEPAGSMNCIYKIIEMDVFNTNTTEKMVVYQALYPPFHVFTSTYDNFYGRVDKNKFPDVKQEYRFEKIDPERI